MRKTFLQACFRQVLYKKQLSRTTHIREIDAILTQTGTISYKAIAFAL